MARRDLGSGAGLAAPRWAGPEPKAADEISFLLSIPFIAGAAVMEGRHAPVDGLWRP